MIAARKQNIAIPYVSINIGVPTLHQLYDIFEIAMVSGSRVAANTFLSNSFYR